MRVVILIFEGFELDLLTILLSFAHLLLPIVQVSFNFLNILFFKENNCFGIHTSSDEFAKETISK